MKGMLIVLLIMLLAANACGNDQKLDSLQRVFKNHKRRPNKINLLFEIGLQHQTSSPDNAIHYYNKAK
jgi:hypothetical protein